MPLGWRHSFPLETYRSPCVTTPNFVALGQIWSPLIKQYQHSVEHQPEKLHPSHPAFQGHSRWLTMTSWFDQVPMTSYYHWVVTMGLHHTISEIGSNFFLTPLYQYLMPLLRGYPWNFTTLKTTELWIYQMVKKCWHWTDGWKDRVDRRKSRINTVTSYVPCLIVMSYIMEKLCLENDAMCMACINSLTFRITSL